MSDAKVYVQLRDRGTSYVIPEIGFDIAGNKILYVDRTNQIIQAVRSGILYEYDAAEGAQAFETQQQNMANLKQAEAAAIASKTPNNVATPAPVSATPPVDATVPDPAPTTVPDIYSQEPVADLKVELGKRDIDVAATDLKADLIKKLMDDDTAKGVTAHLTA